MPPEPPPEDVETRRRVLQLVNRYPGLHLREIQRRASANVHLVEYHLNVLERLGLVASREERGYRRIFPATGEAASLTEADRAWLSLLRRSVPLGVVLHLLERGAATHGELAALVPVTGSTLSYHLKSLERAGLVARDAAKEVRLVDPERVRALLRAYHPTPDLIAAWGEMWSDIAGAVRG